MRFMTRSLLAIVLLSVTMALLFVGVSQVRGAFEERASKESRQRPARERVFTVNVETAEQGTASPVITAFGEASSWRSLELRASSGGRLVKMSDKFREGDRVQNGDLLFQIDPTEAEADFQLARAGVLDAAAELADAKAALDLAEAEVRAASDQLALREQALSRSRDLKERGVGSEAAVETANLARSSAVQTEIARKQALAQAQARIARAEIAVTREEIAVMEADRRLRETSVYAPFGGILTDVTAVQGRLVNNNEKLGELIDPSAMEVAFRVSNTQFARLIDANGSLLRINVTATLDLSGAPVSVNGRIERVGAVVGEGQTGRVIYASLDVEDGRLLRPGDFMRVEISEPEISGVVTVPATAVTSDGRMLILKDKERLEERRVEILRRQSDTMIVAGLENGAQYVTRLQPQLGAGVKVKAFSPDAGLIEDEKIVLAPERRDRLIAAVEGNAYIPKDVKARILGQLREETVSASVVQRLESRMGGGGGGNGGGGGASDREASGVMIALAPERRDALIAFVEANDRMPAEAKTRVLEQLRAAEVPEDLVKRLEGRMGGGNSGQSGPSSNNVAQSAETLVPLEDDKRAELRAAVMANTRMPEDAKTRVLAQLDGDRVPAELIARLQNTVVQASEAGQQVEADSEELVSLNDTERAALIVFVNANDRMPAEVKSRILSQLTAERVPADLVERLQERMSSSTSGQSATVVVPEEASLVTLDDARRARLIAFVEGSERMPAEAKSRVLTQLNAAQVPSELVTRLEARAGG